MFTRARSLARTYFFSGLVMHAFFALFPGPNAWLEYIQLQSQLLSAEEGTFPFVVWFTIGHLFLVLSNLAILDEEELREVYESAVSAIGLHALLVCLSIYRDE